MKSGNESSRQLTGGEGKPTDYSTWFGYLHYDDGESDKISLPIRFRERHLTPGSCPAEIQAIGTELQIVVWSDRDNILIRVPLREWQTTDSYRRKLTGTNNSYINVGRYEDNIEVEGGYAKVRGTVTVHDYSRPGYE